MLAGDRPVIGGVKVLVRRHGLCFTRALIPMIPENHTCWSGPISVVESRSRPASSWQISGLSVAPATSPQVIAQVIAPARCAVARGSEISGSKPGISTAWGFQLSHPAVTVSHRDREGTSVTERSDEEADPRVAEALAKENRGNRWSRLGAIKDRFFDVLLEKAGIQHR